MTQNINKFETVPSQGSSGGLGCAAKGGIGCVSVFIGLVILGMLLPDEKKNGEVEGEVSPSTPAKVEKAAPDPNYDAAADLELSLAELDGLVGLEGVKAEVHKLTNLVKVNQARKAQGLKVPPMSYHMVFTGNPGTGKTTVARLLGRIYHALGITDGTFVETDRSGLVGQYTGETAQKTRRTVESALGGILFVDEAYDLYHGEQDNYGKESITTLLKAMEDHRDNLIVIAAGYTDEMRDFLDANSGFRSRFTRTIEFADYTASELATIFRSMAKKNQFTLSAELEESLDDIMVRKTKRRDKTFGNARFVRQLLEDATGRQAERLAAAGTLDAASLSTLTLEDLGLEERKADVRAPTIEEVLAELDGLTGMKSVKDEVRKLIATCRANKLREAQGLESVTMSYNFVFTGNPGTGKTTVARIIAKAFRALGILERGHLVETDRSGLVAAYSGQTALKTNKLIDSAKGGILFIDEAYQLNQGQGDQFGSEAVATLLKRMEDERGTMVVIIAGYKEEMKGFMAINSGLESRFNRVLDFPDFTTKDLAQIFRSQVKKNKYRLSDDVEHWIEPYIGLMTRDKGKTFGNGRWVRNLFEKTVERQSMRIISLENPDKEELVTIRMKDVGISLKDPDASQED